MAVATVPIISGSLGAVFGGAPACDLVHNLYRDVGDYCFRLRDLRSDMVLMQTCWAVLIGSGFSLTINFIVVHRIGPLILKSPLDSLIAGLSAFALSPTATE